MSWFSGPLSSVRNVAWSFLYDPDDVAQTPPPPAARMDEAPATAATTTATTAVVAAAAFEAVEPPVPPAPVELTAAQKIEAFHTFLSKLSVPYRVLVMVGGKKPEESIILNCLANSTPPHSAVDLDQQTLDFCRKIETLQQYMTELKECSIDFTQFDTRSLFVMLACNVWAGSAQHDKLVTELKRQLLEARDIRTVGEDCVLQNALMSSHLFGLLCKHLDFASLPEVQKQALLRKVSFSQLMHSSFIQSLTTREEPIEVVLARLGKVIYDIASQLERFMSHFDCFHPNACGYSDYTKEIFSNLAAICVHTPQLLPLLQAKLQVMNPNCLGMRQRHSELQSCADQVSLLENAIALHKVLKAHLDAHPGDKHLTSCLQTLGTYHIELKHHFLRHCINPLSKEELTALAQFMKGDRQAMEFGLHALNWYELLQLSYFPFINRDRCHKRISYLLKSPLNENALWDTREKLTDKEKTLLRELSK